MKIKPSNSNQNFKGLYDNKFFLNSLEKISDHSASFSASVSLFSALVLRPVVINSTPNTKKENKKILTTESISSAIAKFALAELVALPIEKAIKKINENPNKFLNSSTIKNLSDNNSLLNSKNYNFLTQAIKTSANFISALPKSILGVALIPIVGDFLFNKKHTKKDSSNLIKREIDKNPNFQQFNKNLNFTGLEKPIAKIINSQNIQDIAKKHSKNDKNIARNISVATDILLSTTSAIGILKSKKIEKERKKPLILNKTLSTALSLISGFALDEIIQNGTKKTIQNFSAFHKNNPKLPKYLEGINILRPTLIFALIYYGIIPFISTFTTDKFSKKE